MIPEHYKPFCKSPAVVNCDYYMDKTCPNTCGMARRIKNGISHQARTGLERFIERYGEDWRMVAYAGGVGVIADNSTNTK